MTVYIDYPALARAREREARATEEAARLRVLLARSQAITAALVAALLPILSQRPELLAALDPDAA